MSKFYDKDGKTYDIFQIYEVLSLIKNSEGINIDTLSEKFNLPKEILKRNISIMAENTEMFYPYTELMVDTDFEENDDIYVEYDIDTENFMLTLNDNERNTLTAIMSHDSSCKYNDIIFKHVHRIGDNKHQQDKIRKITNAAESNKVIDVLYKGKENNIRMMIEPLGIVFYEFENIFYVVGQYNDEIMIYRMDRMIEITITKKSFAIKKDFNMEKYFENVWGMEAGDEVEVMVKFLKEGNVEYKVKRDIEYRKNKIIKEYDDYFIYEDKIRGINSFKSWLRSYGSSAVVLEPELLRNDIIESARKMYDFYSNFNNKNE